MRKLPLILKQACLALIPVGLFCWAYLAGVRGHHFLISPSLFRYVFVRNCLFDPKMRQLLWMIAENKLDAFATVWDTTDGVLLSRKLFRPVTMYGQQKYMVRPNLKKIAFAVNTETLT